MDLKSPGVTKMIAAEILLDIDKYAVQKFDDGYRNHLGCSLIGHDCKRYLWLSFRWVGREEFDGRMQRLFNRGHREEDRFVDYLRGIGCQVWTHDEQAPLNDKFEFPQYRVMWAGGHAGGSLDAIILLPPKFGYDKPILGEFKTKGGGRKWDLMVKEGMPYHEPKHWAQQCSYATEYGFEYSLYLSVNKDKETIHAELNKVDTVLGGQMKQKAIQIVTAQKSPPKLSENPTFSTCAYCGLKDHCHNGKQADVNCRSCKNSVPVENGEWQCLHWNATIPKEAIPKACPHWADIRNA